MCVNCGSAGIGRRDFMKFGAAGAIALGMGGVSPAARAAEGAPTFGPVSQASFLLRLGLEARAAALARAHPNRATKIGRQVRRLISSGQMGQLFQVAAIAAPGLTPPGFE